MSEVVSLMTKKSYAKIEQLVLDASIEEMHTMTSKISQFPVEDGSTISDNIYNEPEKISIQGVVTSTPLPNSPNSSLESTIYAPRDAYDYLCRLRKNKELITVTTDLEVYKNMGITSIRIPKNTKVGGSLQFTIELEKVNIVSSKTVPAIYLKKAQNTNKQAAPTAEQGKQTAKEVSEKRKSQILSFIDTYLNPQVK